MSAVYTINKGVNRSLEFKGVKGPYILLLGAGLVLLFVLFVILFTAGCNTYAASAIILPAGALYVLLLVRLSKRFGEHGLFKRFAKSRLPRCIRQTTKSSPSNPFFLSGK